MNNFLWQHDTKGGFYPFNQCLVFTITFPFIKERNVDKLTQLFEHYMAVDSSSEAFYFPYLKSCLSILGNN